MPDGSKEIWKYCYWMDDPALLRLKIQMEDKGTTMVQAEKNPCEALKGEAGYAEPRTWTTICKHDAAPWYQASKHYGKNLVISSAPLDAEHTPFLETTVRQSTFEPAALPPIEVLSKLAEDEVYRSLKLKGWGEFPKEMGEAILMGLGKLSGKPLDKFEDLLTVWDAVHSNFDSPRYISGKDFDHAPYSVVDSIHISTCCVEIFNLLDSKRDTMLVRPCIGSVIVKVLEKDQYYLVRLAR